MGITLGHDTQVSGGPKGQDQSVGAQFCFSANRLPNFAKLANKFLMLIYNGKLHMRNTCQPNLVIWHCMDKNTLYNVYYCCSIQTDITTSNFRVTQCRTGPNSFYRIIQPVLHYSAEGIRPSSVEFFL